MATEETCELCRGSGFVLADAATGTVTVCRCRTALTPTARMARYGVPERYRDLTLDDFEIGGLSEEGQRQAVNATATASRWAATVRERVEDGRGLLFYGPPGCGKTHLAAATLRAALEGNRFSFEWVDFPELMRELRGRIGRDESVADVVDRISSRDVLVVDELATPKMTDFAEDTLHAIIDRAYRTRTPMIATTMAALDPRAEKVVKLTEALHPMLVSRLREVMRSVPLTKLPDFRARNAWR